MGLCMGLSFVSVFEVNIMYTRSLFCNIFKGSGACFPVD